MTEAEPRKECVKVADEGFTVLCDCPEPKADIVLIHGLQGHPKRTWLYEKPSKIPFGSKKETCYWPEELLPKDSPNCRILTYGYDSQVSHFFSGAANQTNILGHARNFVEEFEEQRRTATGRPLVFVAHSLGGLLVKAILRQASNTKPTSTAMRTIQDIYLSIIGTIFLGTPHRGSDYTDLGKTVALAVRALQFDRSTSLLRDLKVDASILDILNSDFLRLHKERDFAVVTFEEGQGLGIPFLAREKVVRSWSAHLGLPDDVEETYVINADHRKMCRFEGPSCPGYGKVKRAIGRCVQRARTYIVEAEFQRALDALHTAETSRRYRQVEAAYEDTYDWIFTDQNLGFARWLQSTDPLYWIRGKPASGKSTLMKLIVDDQRTVEAFDALAKGTSVAAITLTRITCRPTYFFHERGSRLQHTMGGMLREILHSLLDGIPELKPFFRDIYRSARASRPLKSPDVDFEWDEDVTMGLLRNILEQNRVDAAVLIFIDAIDEYSGTPGNYGPVIRFLQMIQRRSANSTFFVKICFSGRPEQIYLDHFSDVPGFYIQDYTRADILNVISSEVQAHPRMARTIQHGSEADQIAVSNLRDSLARLANGVFLWVRLVLEDLLNEYTDGASLQELNDHLNQVPPDLERYYDYILAKMSAKNIKPEYAKERETMLEILRAADGSLSLVQFFAALRLAPIRDLRSYHLALPGNLDEASRLLKSRCGSLLELQSNESTDKVTIALCPPDLRMAEYSVQFLHQSVKTWSTNRSPHRSTAENGHTHILKSIAYAAMVEAPEFDKQTSHEFVRRISLVEETTHRSSFWILCQAPAFYPNGWRFREYSGRTTSPSISKLAALAGAVLLLEESLQHEKLEDRMDFCLYCHWFQMLKEELEYNPQIASILLKGLPPNDVCRVWQSLLAVGNLNLTTGFESRAIAIAVNILWIAHCEGINPDTSFELSYESGPTTFLHEIAREEHRSYFAIPIVETVLCWGGEVNVVDGRSRTILDVALESLHNLLNAQSCRIFDADHLDIYIKRHHNLCVFLLDHGAKASGQPINGPTEEDVQLFNGYSQQSGLWFDVRLLNPPLLPQKQEGWLQRLLPKFGNFVLWHRHENDSSKQTDQQSTSGTHPTRDGSNSTPQARLSDSDLNDTTESVADSDVDDTAESTASSASQDTWTSTRDFGAEPIIEEPREQCSGSSLAGSVD